MEELIELKNFISKHNSESEGIFINDDISNYVQKITDNSIIVKYTDRSFLKGFIAYYANDFKSKTGYLTMILIDKSFQGKGVGRSLILFSINDLKRKGFLKYNLEVLKSNTVAITFYESLGFQIVEDRGKLHLMTLSLI